MKKTAKRLLLFMALSVPWIAQGQTPVEVPYTEGFETTSTGLPTGWTKVGEGTVAVQSSATYVYEGTNSLKFSGSQKNVVALPNFGAATNTLELIFQMRPESTSSSCGKFLVGYVTDVSSANRFVAIDSVHVSDFGSPIAYREMVINLSGVPTGARVALCHKPTSTAWYWFVDNVDVHVSPTCIKPTGLNVTDLTASGAVVTWRAGGDESLWDVTVTDGTDTTTTTVSDTTYVLSGLNEQTPYTVMVRANCGDETSRSATALFTTPCAANAMPFVEDFHNGVVPPQC